MPKPVVFVIGASGSSGAATVTTLATKYADKVEIRAGVRNPEKAEKLKALPNVSVVQATMGDSNLAKVFAGVTTLYIVTPSPENRTELAISTAKSAKQAGVKHIAVVSITTVEARDTVFGGQFHQIEPAISKLGVPYTIIRLPFFIENYFSFKDSIVNEGTIYNPADPSKPFSTVSVEDIGKASAAILVNPEKYANKIIAIVSDRHSYGDFTKAISKGLGREIKYVRVPYEAAKEKFVSGGWPEWRVNGLFDVLKLIDSSSPLVTRDDLTVFSQITGEQPQDLKTWVDKHAELFKLEDSVKQFQ